MKKLQKFITVLIAIVLSCATLTACGNGGKGSKGSLNITVYDAGFGYAWVENMAVAFEEETGASVTVKPVYDQESQIALIQTGSHTSDILFMVQDSSMIAEDGHLADLTELVYKKAPYGEEGKTIEELAFFSKALNIAGQGKYYAVSYSATIQSLLYNKDTLDEVFGTDDYTLPNTTNEWIKFMDDILAYNTTKGASDPTAVPLISAGNYMEYIVTTWWAQYDGANTFMDYWRGFQNGTFCKDDPTFAKTEGRLEALKMLESVFTTSSKYVHPKTADFFDDSQFKNVQRTFIGEYAADNSIVAFYPCGDWYENEMGSLVEGHEIRMMKTPVLSSITKTFADQTDKQMTDEKLSSIIKKIDDGVAFSESEYGCKESTYNKVFEARNIVSTNGEQMQSFIPVTSKNKELASDFLRFVVSKKGQSVYAQEMKGLHMGYGYDPETDTEVEISDFVQSVHDLYSNDNTTYVYRDISELLSYRGGLAAFTTNNNLYTQAIFTGSHNATAVYNDTYNTLKNQWAKYLSDSNLN